MMNKKRIKLLSYITLTSLVLCSCGGKKKEAPELLDPVTITESFRPVEYGDVGEVKINTGVVVPKEYCYFWDTNVAVEEITVDVGQFVNAGDVLAKADVEIAKDVIDGLYNEIANLNANFQADNEIYNYKRRELELVKKGAKEAGNEEAVKKAEKDLSVIAENNRYDRLLYEYKVAQRNKSIEKQNKLVADGKLVADVSGYVTYVKNLTESVNVTNADNVVVIADYEDTYIEVPEILLTPEYRNLHKNGDTKYYTEIEGERYNLQEIKYTPQELVVADNKGLSPYIRFKIEDNSKLPELGTNIPVFTSTDVLENVMVVGNDSIFEDEKGKYVYVKNGDTKNLRYVEIGKTGRNYSEVVSGVNEGDLLYYSSGSLIPDQYTEYVVEGKEYKETASPKYTHKSSVVDAFFSDWEGQITEFKALEGFDVKQGDLLCTIKTNDGSAKLADMLNEITNTKQNNERALKQYDAAIRDIELAMADLSNPVGGGSSATPSDATPSDATSFYDPYLYQELALEIEQLKCMKYKENANFSFMLNQLQKQYAKMSCDNDGKGYINLVAKKDGTVSKTGAKNNEAVTVGQYLFNITDPKAEKLVLKVKNADPDFYINQTVKFVSDDDKDIYYYGNVIGRTKSDKVYIETKGDDIFVTKCSSSQPDKYFYVNFDKDEYDKVATRFTSFVSSISFTNVVVVPRAAVNEEKLESHTYYYVWRLVDGTMIKQYVTLFEQDTMTQLPELECYIISGLNIGDTYVIEESR